MGKILVADDSSTIQKVVRITLANEQHQLVECMSEDELMVILKNHVFDLILLDFNLSANRSGLQLVQEIRKKSQAPVMAMLGTFDSVDPKEVMRAGFGDTIVKPFESDTFITKCRHLIEAASKPATPAPKNSLPPVMEATTAAGTMDLDSWTVESSSALPPVMDDPSSSIDLEPKKSAQSGDLHRQLADWGMEIPSVIGVGESAITLPPIIGGGDHDELMHFDMGSTEVLAQVEEHAGPTELDLDSTSSFDLHEFEARFDQALPQDTDLAYPDNSNVEEMDVEDDPFSGMKVEMVSLDDLSPTESEAESNISFEQTDPDHQIESLDLEMELEAEQADDLWAVDESIPAKISSDLPGVESYGGIEHNADYIENIQFEAQQQPTAQPKVAQQAKMQDPIAALPFTLDELAEKIRESLAPMIETVIRQECMRIADQVAEKVAWEVIPDVAENIIRKEIKALTESVE